MIDACVTGEAEETGTEIFKKLLDHKPDDVQAGIAFRSDGEVICKALPPLVGSCRTDHQCSLDGTPSPYLSGILPDGRAGVLTGRGCTHHCQYCCFAALGRRTLRLHSTGRVLSELEYIAEQQKRSGQRYVVPIHDDAFTLIPARAKAMCQQLIDHPLGLALSCITRADAVDEELIRLMHEAGFISLAFGLESAVPSVLRATGKVRPPEWHHTDLEPERKFIDQVRQSVVTAKKYGFNVGVSIILGLPTETAEDGEATLRFVKQLPVDFYMHNYLWLFPGTPLWETHGRYGVECTVNEMGLPLTTEYAYDVTRLRPRPKCALENDAHFIRLTTADVLYRCDAPATSGKGTTTVILHADELTPAIAAWLKKTVTVGGTVLQVYRSMKPGEQAQKLYRDRCVLSDQHVPARHHIQLFRKSSRDGSESWQIACAGVDLYRYHKPELVSIRCTENAAPLTAWSKGNKTSSVLCNICEEMKAAGEGELAAVASRIEPLRGVSHLREMPAPPAIEYPGRWVQGQAPCLSLTRMEVDEEGKVRCCRHGEPIGEAGEPRTTIAKRLRKLAREIEIRRGCDKCPITHCPRCPFPGVSDEIYCNIMNTRQPIQRALSWINVYSRLPLLATLHSDRIAAD